MGKSIFYAINFVFGGFAGSMMGVGIWMTVDTKETELALKQDGFNKDLYWTSVYFMIIIGCLALIVSVIGMVAAAAKIKKLKYVYIGVVVFILILELILIIIAGVFWDSVGSDVKTKERMIKEIREEYVSEISDDPISSKWNTMQMDWTCCGSEDYNDYDRSKYIDTTHNQVPWTCCVMTDGGRIESDVVNLVQCRVDAEKETEILDRSDFLHRTGCYSRIRDIFAEDALLLIVLTIIFAAIQVVGLCLAVHLDL